MVLPVAMIANAGVFHLLIAMASFLALGHASIHLGDSPINFFATIAGGLQGASLVVLMFHSKTEAGVMVRFELKELLVQQSDEWLRKLKMYMTRLLLIVTLSWTATVLALELIAIVMLLPHAR